MPDERDRERDVQDELEERARKRREEEERQAERRRRQLAGGGAAAGAGAIAGKEGIDRLTGDDDPEQSEPSIADFDEESLDVFDDLEAGESQRPPAVDERPGVPDQDNTAAPDAGSLPTADPAADPPPGVPSPPEPPRSSIDTGPPEPQERGAPTAPPPPAGPDFTPTVPGRPDDRIIGEQPSPPEPPPAPPSSAGPPPDASDEVGPPSAPPVPASSGEPSPSEPSASTPTPPTPSPAPFVRPDAPADSSQESDDVIGDSVGDQPAESESLAPAPPTDDESVPAVDPPPADAGSASDGDSTSTAPGDSFPGASAPPSSGSSPGSGTPVQSGPDSPGSGTDYPPPSDDYPPPGSGEYPEQPGYPHEPPTNGEPYPDQPRYPEQPVDEIRYFLPGTGDGYPHPRDVYGEPDIVTAAGRQFEVYDQGRIIIEPSGHEGAHQIYWLADGQNAYNPDFHWPGTNNDMQVVDMIATVEPDGDHYINYYPRFYQPVIEEIEAEGYPDYVDPALTGGIPYVTLENGESVFTYTDEEGRQIVKTVNRFDGSATIEYYDGGIVTYYPEGHPDYPNGYLAVSGELDPNNPYYPPDYVPDDEYPPDDIEPGYDWPIVLEADFNGDPDLGFYLATVRYPDGSIHQFDITGRHYVMLNDGARVLVDEPPRMIDINTDTGVIKLDYGEGLPDIYIDPQGNLYSDFPEIQPRIANISYEEGDAYLYVEQENGQLIAYDVEDGRGYQVPNREPESWDQSVFDEPYILNHFYGWHDEYGVPVFASVDGSTYYYSEDYGQLRVLTLGEQSAAGLGFTYDWEEIAQGYLEEYPDGEEQPWDPSYDDGEGWIRVEVDGLLWEIHTDGTSYTIDENGERVLNQAEAPPYRVTYVTQDGRALIDVDDGYSFLTPDAETDSADGVRLLDWDPTEDDGEGWARIAYDGVIYEYRSDGTAYRVDGADLEMVDLYPQLGFVSNYGEVHLAGPDNAGYMTLTVTTTSNGPGASWDLYTEWNLSRAIRDDPTRIPSIVDSSPEDGWVRVQTGDGSVIQYNLDGSAYRVQSNGNLLEINDPKVELQSLDEDGGPRFVTDDGVSVMLNEQGVIDIIGDDLDFELGAGAPEDAAPPEYVDMDDYGDLIGPNYLPTPSENANPENIELIYPDGSVHRFGSWETPDGERFYHVIVNPDGTVTPVEYPEMFGDGDTYLYFWYENGALYASGSASSSYWVTPEGHYITPYGSNYGQVQAVDAERGIVLIRNYAGRFDYDLDGDTTYVTEINPDGSRGERVESDVRLLGVDEQNGTAVFQRNDGTIYQLDDTGRETVLWMGEERAEYLGLAGWEPGEERYIFDDGSLIEVEWNGQEWVPVDYAAPDYAEDYIPDQTYLPEVLESDDPNVLYLRYPDGSVHEFGYGADGNTYHYALIAEGSVGVELPSYPYAHLISIGPEPYAGVLEIGETNYHVAPDGTLHRLHPNADYTVASVDAEAGIVVTHTDAPDGRMREYDLDGDTTYVTYIYPDGTRGPRDESQNFQLLSIDEANGTAVFQDRYGNIVQIDDTGYVHYLALSEQGAANMVFVDYELPADAQQYVRDEDGEWVEAGEDEIIPLDGEAPDVDNAGGYMEPYGPDGSYSDPALSSNLVYDHDATGYLQDHAYYYENGAHVILHDNGERTIAWYVDDNGNPASFAGINAPLNYAALLEYVSANGYHMGFEVRVDANGDVMRSGIPWDGMLDLSLVDPDTDGQWFDPYAAYGPPHEMVWDDGFSRVTQIWEIDGQVYSRTIDTNNVGYQIQIGEPPDAIRLTGGFQDPYSSIWSEETDTWRRAEWSPELDGFVPTMLYEGEYIPTAWSEELGRYVPAAWDDGSGAYVQAIWNLDEEAWQPAGDVYSDLATWDRPIEWEWQQSVGAYDDEILTRDPGTHHDWIEVYDDRIVLYGKGEYESTPPFMKTIWTDGSGRIEIVNGGDYYWELYEPAWEYGYHWQTRITDINGEQTVEVAYNSSQWMPTITHPETGNFMPAMEVDGELHPAVWDAATNSWEQAIWDLDAYVAVEDATNPAIWYDGQWVPADEYDAGQPDADEAAEPPPPNYFDSDDYSELLGANYLPVPSTDGDSGTADIIYPDGTVHRFGEWEMPDGTVVTRLVVYPDGSVRPIIDVDLDATGIRFFYIDGGLYAVEPGQTEGIGDYEYRVTPEGYLVTDRPSQTTGSVSMLDEENGIVRINTASGARIYDLDGDTTYVTRISVSGARRETVESGERLLSLDAENNTATFQGADGTIYMLDSAGQKTILWLSEERANQMGIIDVSEWEAEGPAYIIGDNSNLLEAEWNGQEWLPVDYDAPDYAEETPDDSPPPNYQDFDPNDFENYAPAFIGGEHGNAVRIQLHDGTILECQSGGPTYRIENARTDHEYAVRVEDAPIFEGNGVAGIFRFRDPDGNTFAYNGQGYYLGENPEPYAYDVTIDPDNGIVEYSTHTIAGTEESFRYELRGDELYVSTKQNDGEWSDPEPTTTTELVTIDPGPPAAAIMLFGGGGSHVALDEYGYLSYPYTSAQDAQSIGIYEPDYPDAIENALWIWDADSGQYVPAEMVDGAPMRMGGEQDDDGLMYLGPMGESHPHPAQVYEQSLEQIDPAELQQVLGWGSVSTAHLYPDGSIVAWYGDGSQRVAWLTTADGAPISAWQQVLDGNAYLDYQVAVTNGIVTAEIPPGSQMLIEGVPEEEAEGEYTFYGRYTGEDEAEAGVEPSPEEAEDEMAAEPLHFSTSESPAAEAEETDGEAAAAEAPQSEQPVDVFESLQPEEETPLDEFSRQLEDEAGDQLDESDADDDDGTL